MRMILAPLAGQKAFEDHCSECGKTTDWWVRTATLDCKKKTIQLRFCCKCCEDKHFPADWARTVIADLPL